MGCVTVVIKDICKNTHLDNYIKITPKNIKLHITFNMICSIQKI